VTPDDCGIPFVRPTEHGGWDREQAARNRDARRAICRERMAAERVNTMRRTHNPNRVLTTPSVGATVRVLAATDAATDTIGGHDDRD
jgi:hypothetical protein